jgi:arabinose-5-phosphate isomerase
MSINTSISSKMIRIGKFPVLDESVSLKAALDSMTKFSIGVACFTNPKNEFVGILTDGDLRRLILTKQSPLPALLIATALDFGTRSAKTIFEYEDLGVAIELMDSNQIWDLPVLNKSRTLVGLLNRHNL